MTSDFEQSQNQQEPPKIDYDLIEKDYLPDYNNDDDTILTIKEKIFKLPPFKRRILILYIELGSFSAVAREMNCSSPTIGKYVRKILDEL